MHVCVHATLGGKVVSMRIATFNVQILNLHVCVCVCVGMFKYKVW